MSLGDLGKHCMDLQKKLDHVNSIMKIDQMAQKLFVEAGSEAPMIEDKKNEICVKYEGLQESIQRYREQLGVAGNMHAFQRNIDETLARIKEKLLVIDSSNKGKDLKMSKKSLRRYMLWQSSWEG